MLLMKYFGIKILKRTKYVTILEKIQNAPINMRLIIHWLITVSIS